MSPAPRQWTVLSLLEWTSQHLASKGFEEARLNVDLLLAHVLGVKRLDLYLQFDRSLHQDELARFRELYERRLTHEPLQYVLGEAEFMGLRLTVNRAVLIPRPETEQLVELALEVAGRLSATGLSILDIGTGCGNIALALARQLPSAHITAPDIRAEALQVAAANGTANGIAGVTFLYEDIMGEGLAGMTFDLVIANPPYVSSREYAGLEPEVRAFEPPHAVTDGASGYRFHERIARHAPGLLKPAGALLLEVGYGQAPDVAVLLERAGLTRIAIHNDYAGIPRIVSGYRQ